MDQHRFVETGYFLEHQHKDGNWARLLEEEEPTPLHHTPAEHDPERRWSLRRIFRCESCGERVAFTPGAEGGPSARSAGAGDSSAETARHVVEDR
jgi:hypothetical protein